MKLADLKVGDPVMYHPPHVGGAQRQTVTKVGRKYLYIHRSVGFDRKDGGAQDGYGRVETLEAYERKAENQTAQRALEVWGVRLAHTSSQVHAVAIRDALRPIFDADVTDEKSEAGR